MPFQKRGDRYYSPSGQKFSPKQVRAYYASKKFSQPVKKQKK